MKKLLSLLLIPLMTLYAYGGVPIHSNIATCNLSKVRGDYDSFRWSWAGYDTQTNSIFFANSISDTSTNWTTLTGKTISFKMSKMSETGQITYINTTNMIVVSGENVQHVIDNTNIPPNGTYLAEYWAWEGSSTNITRTLAQGKITVFHSLNDNNDGTWPWPSQTNLTSYLTIANAAATYSTLTTSGGLSSTQSTSVASITGLSSTQSLTVAKANYASNGVDSLNSAMANSNSWNNAATYGITTSGTNFFFRNSATNWAGTWADYAGVYHGINSNGTLRVLTNAWGW